MKSFPCDFLLRDGVWRPVIEESFAYSDGDEAERYLEKTLRNAGDLSTDSLELVEAVKDWPSEYHLSPQRANLLRPLEIPREASVLELGCGCGALTRYLGEHAGRVIAVEGSPIRARLARLRCRDLENVEAVSCNFDDLAPGGPFEIVTLIGVLEYAGIYWRQGGDPFEGMLRFAWDQLTPNGVLILAIENKLGMKYFSGCTEDHLGKPFTGIEGYPDPAGPRTFGRLELVELLFRSGFGGFELLLPFPDYKLPSTLVNGRYTASGDCAKYNLVDWCRERFRDYTRSREHYFNDQLAMASASQTGLFADFANSFLLLAAKKPFSPESAIRPPSWIAKRFNVLRRPGYRTVTTLEESGGSPVIRKERMNDAKASPSAPVQHLPGTGGDFVSNGRSLFLEMLYAIRRTSDGGQEFARLVGLWIDFLKRHEIAGTDRLPPPFVDCLPGNLILDPSAALHYVDDEWRWNEPVPTDWVIFRGLFVFWLECRQWIGNAPPRHGQDFGEFLAWALGTTGPEIGPDRLEELVALEVALHEAVSPLPPIDYRNIIWNGSDRGLPKASPTAATSEARLVGEVESLFGAGRVMEALHLAGEIAEKSPKNAENWNNLGVILQSLGQDKEARDCLRIAVSLNGSFTEASANLSALEATPACAAPALQKDTTGFRVTAIMAVYNEGDVIRHSVGDLIRQGVEVYLIDNCSTDNTVEEASVWLGKGLIHIERFPDDADYPPELRHEYAWKQILRRKEELASTLQADWFIHHDADEFRESPWPGLTLKEAIRAADAMGYNAIQFAVFNFKPTDDSFIPGSDVRETMRYYLPLPEHASHMQVKCWKNTGVRPEIADNGGHNICFEGRKICPTRFLLRHYPIRSQRHGERKVFEDRKARFSRTEVENGWHKHYDHIHHPAHNFLHDPKELHLYDGNVARLQLLSYQAFLTSEAALGEETVARIIRENWFDRRALNVEKNVLKIW